MLNYELKEVKNKYTELEKVPNVFKQIGKTQTTHHYINSTYMKLHETA